jgi:hypothetical protein
MSLFAESNQEKVLSPDEGMTERYHASELSQINAVGRRAAKKCRTDQCKGLLVEELRHIQASH